MGPPGSQPTIHKNIQSPHEASRISASNTQQHTITPQGLQVLSQQHTSTHNHPTGLQVLSLQYTATYNYPTGPPGSQPTIHKNIQSPHEASRISASNTQQHTITPQGLQVLSQQHTTTHNHPTRPPGSQPTTTTHNHPTGPPGSQPTIHNNTQSPHEASRFSASNTQQHTITPRGLQVLSYTHNNTQSPHGASRFSAYNTQQHTITPRCLQVLSLQYTATYNYPTGPPGSQPTTHNNTQSPHGASRFSAYNTQQHTITPRGLQVLSLQYTATYNYPTGPPGSQPTRRPCGVIVCCCVL